MWFTHLTSFNHVFSSDIQKLIHCSESDYMLPMLIATDATQPFGKCRILAYLCVGWDGVGCKGSRVKVSQSSLPPCHGLHKRPAPSSNRHHTTEGWAVFLRNRSSSQGYDFKSSTEAGLQAPPPPTSYTHTHTNSVEQHSFRISH